MKYANIRVFAEPVTNGDYKHCFVSYEYDVYALLFMQWIRDTNKDNAVLEVCNKWENFRGNCNL